MPNQMIRSWLEEAERLLRAPLLKVGGSEFTALNVVYFVLLIATLFYVSRQLRATLVDRLLPRSRLDVSAQRAVAAVTQYVVLSVGMLVVLQSVGVDLTTVNVLAGSVGIGIGFGLQNVAGNFISGLIILLERPIKIGDRIEVGDVEGDVIEIGARSTTVLTNDNIAIIVPNSTFVTENVINWKHGDPRLRFKIPVTVAYGTDVHEARDLLLTVARENPDVLTDPPPSVRLAGFGDHGLHFVLLVWTISLVHRKGVLISALNFAIHDALKAHAIQIPYPQQDVHLRGEAIDEFLKRTAKPSDTEHSAGLPSA